MLQTYDVSSVPPLVATLRDLFDHYPYIKALISATVRNEQTLEVFTKACSMFAKPYPLSLVGLQLTIVGVNEFNFSRLDVPLPKREDQYGFFFSTRTPIHIFLITRSEDMKDPFAI